MHWVPHLWQIRNNQSHKQKFLALGNNEWLISKNRIGRSWNTKLGFHQCRRNALQELALPWDANYPKNLCGLCQIGFGAHKIDEQQSTQTCRVRLRLRDGVGASADQWTDLLMLLGIVNLMRQWEDRQLQLVFGSLVRAQARSMHSNVMDRACLDCFLPTGNEGQFSGGSGVVVSQAQKLKCGVGSCLMRFRFAP